MDENATAVTPRPSGLAAFGNPVLIFVAAGWVLVCALILRNSLFISHDSLSNYSHVWWIGEHLEAGNGLPWHMPVLGHGEALAFPYAFLPWASAGLLWPVFGDWAVTLWIVLGFVGLVTAMFWAFPEVRRGWWAAVCLLNPTLVMAPIIGQLPFLWATAILFAAIGCWRRDRYVLAAILAGVAQATHPAIVGPIAFLLVVGWLPFEKNRARLLLVYAASLAITAPAAYLVLASPVFGDTSTTTKVANFFATLAVRLFVVLTPILLTVVKRNGLTWLPTQLWRKGTDWLPAVLVGVALLLNVVWLGVFELKYAWGALIRKPDPEMLTFTESALFEPGATYRLLRAGDGKVGMYQLLRAGAHLDSEFFPESIDRRSFPDTATYSQFLKRRNVDYVVVFDNYDERWKTNEHQLLDQLTATGDGRCANGIAGVEVLARDVDNDVYRVDASCVVLPDRASAR